jgi:hypothetical protein
MGFYFQLLLFPTRMTSRLKLIPLPRSVNLLSQSVHRMNTFLISIFAGLAPTRRSLDAPALHLGH